MRKSLTIQSKKDVIKLIRSILELIILAILLWLIVRAMINFSIYEDYPESAVSDVDYGFVVVSYFGVERSGNLQMIGVDRLEAHLKAMRDSGYVTVSQRNIIDYYENGKLLPEKALLLIFEDGSRESLIFAQKIMEKYNYKATILNFANSFEKNDQKLLNAKDIKNIEKSSFWETGTNGYRMEYINVFDRDGLYLGEMDALSFDEARKDIGNEYDHYLMDYLRDRKKLPKENYDGMVGRISGDYDKMREIYEREIGYIPLLYAIISPNTGAFGHNSKVSAVNEDRIYELFKMNLNRLGDSFNNRENTAYDLTRIQPQQYWYTNHLLMSLWGDTGQPLSFVKGDAERAAYWDEINGAAEFDGESIILTSLPDGEGSLRLKNSGGYKNFELQVRLNGNKYGSQSVLLRMDEDMKNGIAVTIKNNLLYINEEFEGIPQILFSLDLNILDGLAEENGEPGVSDPGSRFLELTIIDGSLSVHIDKKEAAANIPVDVQTAGFIGLRAETSAGITNQRTLVDSVYDGVFDGFVITEDNSVLFDNKLSFAESAMDKVKKTWAAITNWFIENM